MRRLLRKIIFITMINMNSRDFHKFVGKDIYCTSDKVLGGDDKNSSQGEFHLGTMATPHDRVT